MSQLHVAKAETGPAPSPLYSLTPAEVVFAPFHDPAIDLPAGFCFEEINGINCQAQRGWCYTNLIWDGCSPGREAARLTVPVQASLKNYDTLIFSLSVPREASVQFSACIDGNWHTLGESVAGNDTRQEIQHHVTGELLEGAEAVFTAREDGPRQVSLSWFGLGQSELVERLEPARPVANPFWLGLILPPEQWTELQFTRGLLFDAADLPRLRAKKKLPGWQEHFAVLEKRANRFMERVPEKDLGDYSPWSDIRYLRRREHGREPYFWEALTLGFVGLINEDAPMQRHALRYLMCMLHTPNWCQSAESRMIGSTWDQRAFVEEMTSTSVSLLLDWFDFALTPRAKELGHDMLWNQGLSFIERDLMKREYMYHMNQGPWFCRARVLGGLLLETSWPRVGDYVDRAFAALCEGMDNYMLPDGGTDEGMGYCSLTMHATLPATIAYARARNLHVPELLPAKMRGTEEFLATMSAVEPGKVLLDGDNSTDYLVGDTIPILAGLFPGSTYDRIVGACLLKERPPTYFNQYVLDGLFGFVFGPDELPEPETIVPQFSVLPHSGHLTSLRHQDGHSLRLHLAGSKANPSHSHFDKGNFTAELDGVPFLIDRGIVRYDDARIAILPRSEMHNIITPCYDGIMFAQQARPLEPVIPEGEGDETKLNARINLSNVWREEMKYCRRTLTSPSPDSWTVHDVGEMLREGQVVFHLQSPYPFEIDGNAACIEHNGIRLRVVAEWAQAMEAGEESIDFRFEPIHHLKLWSARLTSFDIETTFERIS